MAETRLILASQSPRRAQLLHEAGYVFQVQPSEISEPTPRAAGAKPEHWAEALSYFKARDACRQVRDGVVLAADTLVACAGDIFGKAHDESEARHILQSLAGTTHQVITGVSVIDAASGRRLIQHEVSTVTMRPMASEELDAYLATGLWRDKAGAYGIQDSGDGRIERIEGSFTNVVGLPMERVKSMLEAFGVRPSSGQAASRRTPAAPSAPSESRPDVLSS
jgi:septum formation protein